MISFVIRSMGFRTVETGDAESTLDVLREHPVCLAIVDVMLPGMPGTELVDAMRGLEDGSVPTILISAHGEPPSHEADRFVAKPFDIDDLSSVVNELVGNGSNGKR